MTRKDFEAIAVALGGVIRNTDEGTVEHNTVARNAILRSARALLPTLGASNPRFDKERFLNRIVEVANV